MTNKAIQAMDLNKEIHKENGIDIKGNKKYTKVVHRIEAFRRIVGYDYGIDTEVTLGNTGALVKATITNENGFIVGSGHAFTKNIQADKSIEKCESTAIGRALASLSLGGDEYASFEEIETHQDRYVDPVVEKVKDFKKELSAEDMLHAAQNACDTLENSLLDCVTIDDFNSLLDAESKKIERFENYPDVAKRWKKSSADRLKEIMGDEM